MRRSRAARRQCGARSMRARRRRAGRATAMRTASRAISTPCSNARGSIARRRVRSRPSSRRSTRARTCGAWRCRVPRKRSRSCARAGPGRRGVERGRPGRGAASGRRPCAPPRYDRRLASRGRGEARPGDLPAGAGSARRAGRADRLRGRHFAIDVLGARAAGLAAILIDETGAVRRRRMPPDRRARGAARVIIHGACRHPGGRFLLAGHACANGQPVRLAVPPGSSVQLLSKIGGELLGKETLRLFVPPRSSERVREIPVHVGIDRLLPVGSENSPSCASW